MASFSDDDESLDHNHNDDDDDDENENRCTCTLVCRVQLWLHSRSDIGRVKESLSDPEVQFLDLHIDSSFLSAYRVGGSEIQDVMETIGTLPLLQRLDITCNSIIDDDDNDNHNNNNSSSSSGLPVSAIQLAFTKDLTHLFLMNVKLSGNRNDFESFATATQQLSKLHVVVFAQVRLLETNSHISNSNNNNNNNSAKMSTSLLDPFVLSMSKISSLGHLLISGGHELGTIRPTTCAQLLKKGNNYLRDLCLGQLSLDTEHLYALANASMSWSRNSVSSSLVTTNHNILRELDLQCRLTLEGAHALAKLLQNNRTLEELTLRLTSTKPTTTTAGTLERVSAAALLGLEEEEDYDWVRRVSLRIAAVRARKRKAKKDLVCSEEDPDDDYDELEYQRNVVLAQAIVQSRWLTNFVLESENLSTSTTLLQPFHAMLQDNYSLEKVRLRCKSNQEYCLEEEIAFYTRLNKMGRRHLFQCPHCSHNDESYVRMLCELNNNNNNHHPNQDSDSDNFDLSAYYYFCRSKPTLLVGKNQRRETATKNSTRGNKGTLLGKRKRLFRAAKYNGVSYKH